MHLVGGREDAVPVGVDVADGEADELSAAPKRLAEEMVGVVGVGEGDLERAASHTDLLDVEHGRCARGEVPEAGPEEEPRQIDGPPPPRDGPAPQGVLHNPARWVLQLLGDGRTAEGRTSELHGGWRKMGCGVKVGEGLGALLWAAADLVYCDDGTRTCYYMQASPPLSAPKVEP